MSASVAGWFAQQSFTDAGNPLVGGRLYTYVQGTTTFKAAYTDAAGLVPHTYTYDGLGGQYIGLDARGELPAPLYLAPGSYDIALKRADGSTVWTRRADPTDDAADDVLARLANAASASQGAALVAYNVALSYPGGSVGHKLKEIVSVFDFMSAAQIASVQAYDFIEDVTIPLQAALASGAMWIRMPAGGYPFSSQLVVPGYRKMGGDGFGLFEGTGATRLLKRGNFTGVVLSGASQLCDLVVEGDTGNGGDGIQVLGGRSVLRNVGSFKHGRDGIKVGDYAVSAANTNLFRVENCISRANVRHGCYLGHEGETTAPDANAGTIVGLEVSYNGSDGLRIGEAVDNTIIGLASQSNGGWGFHLMQYAKGNRIDNPYTEANTLGDGYAEAGADRNHILGFRSGQNNPLYANSGADNVFWMRYGSISTYPLHGTPEAFVEVVVQEQTTSGHWHLVKEATTRNLLIDLQATGAGGDVVVKSSGGGAAGLRFDTGGDTGAFRGILKRLAVTLNFGSIATNSSVDVVVALSGADSTYLYLISAVHAIPAGINVDLYWDPGTSQVKARATNTTGGSVVVNGAFNLAALKIG